jgi:hypothetical protein
LRIAGSSTGIGLLWQMSGRKVEVKREGVHLNSQPHWGSQLYALISAWVSFVWQRVVDQEGERKRVPATNRRGKEEIDTL